VYSRPLISIALILILRKTALKQNHSESPDIAFVRIMKRRVLLSLQRIDFLRRNVEMRCVAFCE
jgi:hypothetical protein